MPKAIFKVEGEIEDFERIDNIYRVFKRESEKLLGKWKMNFNIQYEESEEEGEIK